MFGIWYWLYSKLPSCETCSHIVGSWIINHSCWSISRMIGYATIILMNHFYQLTNIYPLGNYRGRKINTIFIAKWCFHSWFTIIVQPAIDNGLNSRNQVSFPEGLVQSTDHQSVDCSLVGLLQWSPCARHCGWGGNLLMCPTSWWTSHPSPRSHQEPSLNHHEASWTITIINLNSILIRQ